MRLLNLQVLDYATGGYKAYVTLRTQDPMRASTYSNLEESNWILHAGPFQNNGFYETTFREGTNGCTQIPH